MRIVLIVLSVLIGIVGYSAAPASAAPPSQPDLRGYLAVIPDAFVMNDEAYFQTPDGLLCSIQPDRGVAGCDGRLPGTMNGVNEIVLTEDANARGLRETASSRFVKSTGDAAPVLREGQKIVFGDFECAVAPGPFTACTKGQPVTQWMVVSPNGTGIGPATDGLPPGFPDPNEFVLGDETYVVGQGAKNLFPLFTVDGGLTCSIIVYSGGEIGCDGPLPGVTSGQNEVFMQLPGTSGIRRADSPKFSTPAYPGPIKQLPVGYRVNGIGSTCMAIPGGVACLGTIAGALHGFQVSPAGVSTIGG
ncbi:hypothetical protein [Mycolicibacterium hodleri]|uniref:hypothetical protein n=1 Tax=Mycolicibacterium hodleri TaxID=49897 RepID=UPI001F23CF46|nr:hypothetical protein [Mycolicibacterium hodleri]